MLAISCPGTHSRECLHKDGSLALGEPLSDGTARKATWCILAADAMHGCEQRLAVHEVVGQALMIGFDDRVEVRKAKDGPLLVDEQQQCGNLAGTL